MRLGVLRRQKMRLSGTLRVPRRPAQGVSRDARSTPTVPAITAKVQQCSSTAWGKAAAATWEIRAIKVKTCETGSCTLLVVRRPFRESFFLSHSEASEWVVGQLSGGHVPHSSRQVLCHPALRTDLSTPPTTPCPKRLARLSQAHPNPPWSSRVCVHQISGWLGSAQRCVQPCSANVHSHHLHYQLQHATSQA